MGYTEAQTGKEPDAEECTPSQLKFDMQVECMSHPRNFRRLAIAGWESCFMDLAFVGLIMKNW